MKSILQGIERVALGAFLFFLPFQIRLILFQKFWYFSEWDSFFLYGTDLLIVVAILIHCVRVWRKEVPRFQFQSFDWLLVAFFFASIFSTFFATPSFLGAYHVIKLAEMLAVFWYMRSVAQELLSSCFVVVFTAGTLFQSAVAIAQFFLQGDLGLQRIGESVLRPDYLGVASFYTGEGIKVMRAYGLTPHPNVLAAYLLLGLASIGCLYSKFLDTKWLRLVFGSAFVVTFFALFFTFSRTIFCAAFLGGLYIGIRYWSSEFRKPVQDLLILTVSSSLIAGIFFSTEIKSRVILHATDEAVSLRVYYNKEALKTNSSDKSYLFLSGVGVGNFVPWLRQENPRLPRHLYQPVHNMYLLIYSETGLIGIMLFLGFVGAVVGKSFYYRRTHFSGIILPTLLCILLFIGLFDHFPVTLQQGRLLLWSLLGLVAAWADS